MDYYVGQNYEFVKTIAENDVFIFAGNCGDFNPVHLDKNYAETTPFQRRIVHGALINSYISAALGMHLPGLGTIYLSQESHFLKPVYINDTIRVCLEINDINEKGRAHLKTTVLNQQGEIVLDGTAYVIVPSSSRKIE